MNEVTKKVGGNRLRMAQASYAKTGVGDNLIASFTLETRCKNKEQFERLEKKLDGMVAFTGTAKDELIDALGQEIDDRDKVEQKLLEKIGLLETLVSLKDETEVELRNQLADLTATNAKLLNALRPFAAQLGVEL